MEVGSNLYRKWLLRKRVVDFDVGIRFLADKKRGKMVGHEVVAEAENMVRFKSTWATWGPSFSQ